MKDSIGNYSTLIPPKDLSFPGGGGYEPSTYVRHSFHQMNLFKTLGGLSKDSEMLEVGCGTGNMALALTDFLSREGSYTGFDLDEKRIAWCQSAYREFDNFTFEHSDIENRHYNSGGVVRPESYKFPYPDASFDFVVLNSVFTHMLPEAVWNYLSEISRVLRPNGTVFATFFLLNMRSFKAILGGTAGFDFKYSIPGALCVNPNNPELAVAYYEPEIVAHFGNKGLNVKNVHPGQWASPQSNVGGQDIVIAARSID